MKPKICCTAVWLLVLGQTRAQPADLTQSAQASVSTLSRQYTIIDRGPNSRTWARTVVESDSFGGTITRTSFIYELASGMHYKGPNGEWLESQESFSILPDGSGAVAIGTLELARIVAQARANLGYGEWTQLRRSGEIPFCKRKGEMLVVIGAAVGELNAQNPALSISRPSRAVPSRPR